jgi:hypothetical protein
MFTYKKTTGRSQGRVDKLCWYTGRTDTAWTSYSSKKINCIRKVSTVSAAALSSLIHCQARDANTTKAVSVCVLFSPLFVSFPLSAFVHGDFRKWEVVTCWNIMEAIRGLRFLFFIGGVRWLECPKLEVPPWEMCKYIYGFRNVWHRGVL